MSVLSEDFIGKTIGVKVNQDNFKLMNRVFDKLGIDSENYNNQEAVLMIFEHLDKKKPIEIIKEVSQQTDLDTISNQKQEIHLLKEQITELKAQLEAVSANSDNTNKAYTEMEDKFNSLITELTNKNNSLQSEINQLTSQNRNLSTIPVDEIRIKLNPFYNKLIDVMFANKDVVKGIEHNVNKTALLSISTPDKNQNKINYILNCITVTASGCKFFGEIGRDAVQNIYLRSKQ